MKYCKSGQMNKYYLVFMTMLFCTMMLLSCAEQKRQASLEDTLSMYERAIRWSAFDKASKYLKESDNVNISRLDGVQVTSYIPMGRDVSDDGLRIEENVKIGYILQKDHVERSLVDHQVWKYDEPENRWYLMSSLPDFMVTSHSGYDR